MTRFNSYLEQIDRAFLQTYFIRHGQLQSYQKNELFLREGVSCPYLGFIKSGILKFTCFNRTEKKEYSIGFAFPLEFVADYPGCLYGTDSAISAKALTPCELYVIAASPLKRMLEECPANQEKARNFAEQLFLQTFARYLDFYRLTPEERYQKLLKQCPDILQLLSLKEIASYLKITPTHFSRIRKRQI